MPDAEGLFEALRRPEPWAPALIITRQDEDGAALEISFPLTTPNGSVLWRRSALVLASNLDDTGHVVVPGLFYDYLHEWDASRIAVIADRPFTDEAAQLEDKPRSVFIDLGQEPYASADLAEVVEATLEYLHPNPGAEEIGEILTGMASDQGRRLPTDFELCDMALENMLWSIGFVAACCAPHNDFGGSIEVRDGYSIHGLFSGEHHIYVDHQRLHQLLMAHALLADRARNAGDEQDFWSGLVGHARVLAELAFRVMHARDALDAFSGVLGETAPLRHPELQRIVAAALPGLGVTQAERLCSAIGLLTLDEAVTVEALENMATGPARPLALIAVTTLGLLRAEQARPALRTLTRDRRQAMRAAAEAALRMIDSPPSDDSSDGRVALTGQVIASAVDDPAPPEQRFFHGPMDTLITVSNQSSDWTMCGIVTTHPDGSRDLAMGPFEVWRTVAARLLGLVPPPPDDQVVKMGEAVMFDKDGNVISRETLDGGDSPGGEQR